MNGGRRKELRSVLRLTMLRLVVLGVVAAAAAAMPGDGMGPGPNEWTTVAPEKFGLDGKALEAAAMEMADVAVYRYCTLVVKDGVILYEKYHHNNSETMYESDSMGKTVTPILIGMLVKRYGLDIDKPLAEYGVPEAASTPGMGKAASWNRSGVNYFKQLTARHVITQTTGYGAVPPGEYFTYNSDFYIQYASYAIRALTKEAPMSWATREFAIPLGVPDLFIYDGTGGEISAGGGQLYTCRDAARIGQIVANDGWWTDAAGKPFRFYDQAFADQFVAPSFPRNNAAYGFLVWTNNDVTGTGTSCCAPRWGHAGHLCTGPNKTMCASCCSPRVNTPGNPAGVDGNVTSGAFCNTSASTLNEADSSVDIHPGEPQAQWMERVGSALIKKNMIGDNIEGTIPAPNDVGVGMGWAARYIIAIPSQNLTIISIGTSLGWADNCWGGYDDSYTVSLVWNTIAKALKPSEFVRAKYLRAELAGELATVVTKPMGKRHRGKTAGAVVQETLGEGESFAGSCTCLCAPGMGYGRCFNMKVGPKPATAASCNKIPGFTTNASSPYFKQAEYCAAAGTPKQCKYPQDKDVDMCPGANNRQVRACAPVAGQPNLATAGCSVQPKTFGNCKWSPTTCVYTPFIPPGFAAGNKGITTMNSNEGTREIVRGRE